MCGIAGILNFKGSPASQEQLKKMTDAIAHRGPDGEGHLVDRELGLGHRRLSIIDLSDFGSQPMTTGDGRFSLSYNGEVYNYRELRSELETLGHGFRSQTDSEVVLHALAEWGPSAINRFNGMFGLAFWDKLKRQLILARDRYGIKPLYYARVGDTLLFGSEIKAILAHELFKTEIDREGLLEYFTFQNFFTDKTLFKNVHLLPAGSYLILNAKGGTEMAAERYWDYNFLEPETHGSEQEMTEELQRLFEQAVKRQLVGDVELGSYLSGGMDSGSITAQAALQLPYIKTFTCGFDLSSASGIELSFDERSTAEHMSYLFKTEHYEMVLKAGDMERCLPAVTWHLEEPRVGQSYPNFYVSRLASKFVKVVLSGAGGDEIFAGYPWRYYRAVVNSTFDDYIDKYYLFWQRLIPNSALKEVFQPIWSDVKHVWTRDIFESVFNRHAKELTRPEDYVNHSLYFEAKTFLNGLLVVEDKLSMAHSLETRLPFLDNDLVDFAMRVPTKFKLGNLAEVVRLNENESVKKSKYFERTKDGKLLLRKAMSRYMPEKIYGKEKQGFSAPDASWFKGDSIEYVKRVIWNDNARIYEFMDRAPIRRLVTEHIEGKQNHRLLIWSLLNFENWCVKFL